MGERGGRERGKKTGGPGEKGLPDLQTYRKTRQSCRINQEIDKIMPKKYQMLRFLAHCVANIFYLARYSKKKGQIFSTLTSKRPNWHRQRLRNLQEREKKTFCTIFFHAANSRGHRLQQVVTVLLVETKFVIFESLNRVCSCFFFP